LRYPKLSKIEGSVGIQTQYSVVITVANDEDMHNNYEYNCSNSRWRQQQQN